MKLMDLINESWLEDQQPLTQEQKNVMLQKISEFNQYGKHVYSEGDATIAAKYLQEICKFASSYISESGDKFDKITENRNLKELNDYTKQFTKLANEHKMLEQRLQSLYEDIGVITERYFKIVD